MGLCPSNLDFESGNFTGWECRYGASTNPLNAPLPNIGEIPGKHTIISAATAITDPFGFFPQISPLGSAYSVKLGNHSGGGEAESISYTYTIPATLTTFSILMYYAVVIESSGHPVLSQQPRFQARIKDVSSGSTIPCVDFDFVTSQIPGGFQVSPVPGNQGVQVYYKDWTPISINLDAYIGQTIMIEFVTRDCYATAHAGYAYVDMGTACNGVISGNFICPGETDMTLTAPFGFQSYQWYADAGLTIPLANTQTLYLNPLPAVGTVYPVVCTPFPGFGCPSTLFATIDVGANPAANAGPDQLVCNGQSVQIGAPPNPIYSYLWSPASQVSSTISSSPMAWTVTATPEKFWVDVTDIITGCKSSDTSYLTAKTVDDAVALSGQTTYCTGIANPGVLSVSNLLAAVQWYEANTPIPGANGYTFQPTASGNYWAQVQQNGCTDSTAITAFTVNPTPVSVAGSDANICANQTIQIGAATNPAYTYSWTPAAQVSNPAIGDPQAWVNDATPVQFTVRTTDAITGCYSEDNVVITGRVVDTLLSLNGKIEYCNGDLQPGSLSVNPAVAAVQWYDGVTPIPGATGFTYLPTISGSYWAELQQFGCTDSTRTTLFAIHAVPLVGFTASSDTGCITNHSFVFTNSSTPPDGANLSYLWRFSDGTTQTLTDAVKTFITTGSYTVKLITTSEFGCADSTLPQTVHVLPNGVADFRWDSICVNRPSLFHNRSNEKGSVQVSYSWNFNNSGPIINVKDPGLVIFSVPGTNPVTLTLTALGCENDPSIVSKIVHCNVSRNGVQYRAITVPEGATQFIRARDSIGTFFQWLPQIQLNNYNTRFPLFTATDDVLYQIRISDIHTCVTIDTLQMLVLKKPGYYLPTAFTPNGDGLNDVAIPYLVKMKSLVSFSVFNRWGARIFYSQQEGKGWDGRSNGEPQPTGVYVWILEFMDNNNKKVTQKGTITVIR